MLAWHRFFALPVSEGGLGLEFSDSFFFYQNSPPWPCFSYFKGTSFQEEPYAPVLRDLIRAGYLDTTHALGYFDPGGYSRRHAEMACRTLEEHGLRIMVWTNHGGYGNIQNVGGRNYSYHHKGDLLESGFYHLDLSHRMGIRYYAICSSYADRLCLSPECQIVSRSKTRPKVRRLSWPWRKVETGVIQLNPDWSDRTSLLYPIVAQDGTVLQGFYRYHNHLSTAAGFDERLDKLPDGRIPGPNIGRIARQINQAGLDRLVKEQGCSVLYQHFSTLVHLPERRHTSEKLVLNRESLASLELLSEYYHSGKVWVASLSALLDYVYMINAVDVELTIKNHRAQITVVPRKGFEINKFSGLTVVLPDRVQEVTFVGPEGREIPGQVVGPDENGTHHAMIPTVRLPEMDWDRLAGQCGVRLPQSPRPTVLDQGAGDGFGLS